MELKERVKSWGLPEYFSDKGIEYSVNESGHFCLIDKAGDRRFEMRFTSFENDKGMFPIERDVLTLIWIQIVRPEDRNKGVATYYLDKLVSYCKDLSITTIELIVGDINNKSKEFSDTIPGNHLEQQELLEFYKKHIEVNGGIELKYKL